MNGSDKKSCRRSSVLRCVYNGHISEGGWHRYDALFRVYRDIRHVVKGAELRLITRVRRRAVLAAAKQYLSADALGGVEVMSAPDSRAVLRMMEGCDIGLLPYHIPKGEHAERVARTVFATKTSEYLCAGLPVLVNRWCEGAVKFVEANRLGVGVDISNGVKPHDLERLISYRRQSAKVRERAQGEVGLPARIRKQVTCYERVINECA